MIEPPHTIRADIVRHQRANANWDHVLAYAYRVKEYLPLNAHVLDIGCGIGLVGYALAKVRPDLRLTLLDSTGNDKHVRFSKTGYWINDLDLTRETVNGLAHVEDISTYAWAGVADVAISTFSWGFHYPMSVYLLQIKRMSVKTLIVDLRDHVEVGAVSGYGVIDRFHIWGKARSHVFSRG